MGGGGRVISLPFSLQLDPRELWLIWPSWPSRVVLLGNLQVWLVRQESHRYLAGPLFIPRGVGTEADLWLPQLPTSSLIPALLPTRFASQSGGS